MAQPVDWNTIGVLTGILVAAGSLFAWFLKNTFRFGEISHRLTSVETDVKDIATEVKGTNKRIDDLILILAQNGGLGNAAVPKRRDKPRPVLS